MFGGDGYQPIFSPIKYLCVTFSCPTAKLLPHKIIYDYGTYIWLFCWFPTHAANTLLWRSYSSKKKQETDEEFDARWEAYFNREDIDAWELRKGVNDLYGHDLVPEPKIVVAMLKAARRINDVAMAVRILEAVKEKAAGDQKIYSYIIDGVKPTLEELGISTPEELGLAWVWYVNVWSYACTLLIVHPLESGDGVGHLSAGSTVLKQWKYM